MQQIINFLIRYKLFLLYIFLLFISLLFTIQTHSYHQSKYLNSANYFSGGIYNITNNLTSYFNLREENNTLIEENRRLRHQLYNSKDISNSTYPTDSSSTFTVVQAKVVKNSFSNQRNYITINKGSSDSIQQDMGVITNKGILGIVENTSNRFATVQSILNENSSINAKIKNSNHFGSLEWDSKDYNTVQLVDIPRLVSLTIGDTIVTGAMSSIFPENIPIGTIKKFDLDVSKSFYFIDVALFNDMTNIKNVYIVKNKKREEIIELQEETIADDQ
ncbi:rod shape-determining protein MreC [Maribacter sp. CXY002]|uniref:rod shape-determining protein MreC n=1 Tax=Maribacter luteocoastalis TaxID=3407671 RepID=UPI003B67296F